jgi:hypothetical protein
VDGASITEEGTADGSRAIQLVPNDRQVLKKCQFFLPCAHLEGVAVFISWSQVRKEIFFCLWEPICAVFP